MSAARLHAMIRLRGVSKRYPGGSHAIRDVDLDVAEGELVVLLGESGSGKTTTLEVVNRLLEPDSGTVQVAGQDVRAVDPIALRRSIGYVIQGVGLFPHLDVAANIGIVPRLLGWSPAAIAERTEELLAVMGLPPAEFRGRRPAELSGGQQQRVGVARALAARPRVLLMDEPFGALDPVTRASLQDELRGWRQSLGLTILLVTHDMVEAVLLADRIAVLRAGRVVQVGTPHELLSHPADAHVAELMRMPSRQAERVAAVLGAAEEGRQAP